MENEKEAGKINRMRKELSASRDLTAVFDDCQPFETATNSHFNRKMNKQALAEKEDGKKITTSESAKKALENIKVMLEG